MVEQLIAEVGVSTMTGCSIMAVGVGIVSILDAQALKIKILAMEIDNIKSIRFICFSF